MEIATVVIPQKLEAQDVKLSSKLLLQENAKAVIDNLY
jgi:hypothetical protein